MFGLKPEEVAAVLVRKRTRDAFNMLRYVADNGEQGSTCDEALVALSLPHQSGSPRFWELVRAGCLQPTKRRRKTQSGASAVVHVVPKEASFLAYLAIGRMPGKTKVEGLSTREQAILDAGNDFLKRWKAAKTKKGQNGALTALVGRLCTADKLPV